MRAPFHACAVLSLLLATPSGVRAQAGGPASVQVSGQVSAVVALSARAGQTLGGDGGAQVTVTSIDATTIAVSIYGSGGGEASVRLPLMLRSNVGYSLRAAGPPRGEVEVSLSVAGVRATGGFVNDGAVEGITAGGAPAGPEGVRFPRLTVEGAAPPVEILSGPPVSKAGNFSSPDNALEVELSIRLQTADAGQPWSTELTITAVPLR